MEEKPFLITREELLEWLLEGITIEELDSMVNRLFDPEYAYLNKVFPRHYLYKIEFLKLLHEMFPTYRPDLKELYEITSSGR